MVKVTNQAICDACINSVLQILQNAKGVTTILLKMQRLVFYHYGKHLSSKLKASFQHCSRMPVPGASTMVGVA